MNPIYQEKTFSGLLAILPGTIGVFFVGIFLYSGASGTFEDPTSAWFLFGVGILLILAAINFAFLKIEVTAGEISVRFGVFHYSIPVANISESYIDKASNISYGGFGIRLGWANGKRRIVYNIMNAPRIVIQQRFDTSREFVFSTRNPEAVIKAIREVSGIR